MQGVERGIPKIILEAAVVIKRPKRNGETFRRLLRFIRRTRFRHLNTFGCSRRRNACKTRGFASHASTHIGRRQLSTLVALRDDVSLTFGRSHIKSRVSIVISSFISKIFIYHDRFRDPRISNRVLIGCSSTLVKSVSPCSLTKRFVGIHVVNTSRCSLVTRTVRVWWIVGEVLATLLFTYILMYTINYNPVGRVVGIRVHRPSIIKISLTNGAMSIMCLRKSSEVNGRFGRSVTSNFTCALRGSCNANRKDMKVCEVQRRPRTGCTSESSLFGVLVSAKTSLIFLLSQAGFKTIDDNDIPCAVGVCYFSNVGGRRGIRTFNKATLTSTGSLSRINPGN